jgi:hypothetical protein
MMIIEEIIDQLAHDWMQKECPELYRVIETQVRAGKGKDAILSFCSAIRGANEFIISQVEGTIDHLRRGQAAWPLIHPLEM